MLEVSAVLGPMGQSTVNSHTPMHLHIKIHEFCLFSSLPSFGSAWKTPWWCLNCVSAPSNCRVQLKGALPPPWHVTPLSHGSPARELLQVELQQKRQGGR